MSEVGISIVLRARFRIWRTAIEGTKNVRPDNCALSHTPATTSSRVVVVVLLLGTTVYSLLRVQSKKLKSTRWNWQNCNRNFVVSNEFFETKKFDSCQKIPEQFAHLVSNLLSG